jgi:metal-responsive CopG/Arc/MetJ family transcriptional regulator
MNTTAISHTEPARFERLTIACPPPVLAMIDQAAAKRFQNRSEFARQAIIAEVRRAGVLDGRKGST